MKENKIIENGFDRLNILLNKSKNIKQSKSDKTNNLNFRLDKTFRK